MEMEKDQKVHPKTGEKADDVVEHIQQGNSNRKIFILLKKNDGISLGKPYRV